jgi:hypothetical protein
MVTWYVYFTFNFTVIMNEPLEVRSEMLYGDIYKPCKKHFLCVNR